MIGAGGKEWLKRSFTACRCQCRIRVHSGSLDIVYNPEFFSTLGRHFSMRAASAAASQKLSRRAQERYEAWKASTKEELFETTAMDLVRSVSKEDVGTALMWPIRVSAWLLVERQ